MSKIISKTRFGVHVTEIADHCSPTFVIQKQLDSFVGAVLSQGVSTYGIPVPSTVVCGETGINFIWETAGEDLDETLIHSVKIILINLMADLAFSNPATSGDIFNDFSNFSIEYDLADILLSECQFEVSFGYQYTNQSLHEFVKRNRKAGRKNYHHKKGH